ncbi:hypothetical protein [Burkholderia pseudomallei]|uniref:hypothetical protein n=1 Tax=Burkholderia pseudomallei TaxID=28450 RepID=UPI00097716CC|nr:hypothetical protein [Burkholderia pseudomallei]
MPFVACGSATVAPVWLVRRWLHHNGARRPPADLGQETGNRQTKRGIAQSETIDAAASGGHTVRAASIVDSNQIPQTYAWLQWPCQ